MEKGLDISQISSTGTYFPVTSSNWWLATSGGQLQQPVINNQWLVTSKKFAPFDTINHELLVAKLHAYGFSIEALEVLLSYLQERWQRVEINTTFSSRTQLLHGNPRGSVLGPMLFNIYINDMFFALNEIDICNFADDTTLQVCDSNLKTVLESQNTILSQQLLGLKLII